MSERGVTSTVEFVLVIAIAAILMSGLIIAASTLIDRQNTSVGRSQMEAVGQQVAGGIESADRLNRTGDTTQMNLEYDLPERILSSGYTVDITPSSNTVEVNAQVTDQTVTVPYDSDIEVAQAILDGGDFVITYNSTTSPNKLEVTDA